MTEYWIDGPAGCPVGGPFDLWRKNYFLAHGRPPEDTAKMYPALTADVVATIAVETVSNDSTLDELLRSLGDGCPIDQVAKAHAYFSEWRKRAPFMPEAWNDVPLRPARTTPEPLEEFLDDWRAHHPPSGDGSGQAPVN